MTVIDEVKQRVDIVELIGRYVELKRAGSTYKGLCPFHDERTPSFVVFPQSGTWRCFGACGIGGDAFSFLMQRENLEFREALQQLANELGITLEEEHDSSQDQRNRLYGVNEAAAGYFYEILRHHNGAQEARAYLERRGINDTVVEQFRIGFALDSWTGLRDYLSEKGWSVEEQLAAGLVKRHEERQSIYDAFRGRVMIPIRDRQGRIIGFGGRVLGDGQPKYLNTAETALFQKSHIIFGLDVARETIRRDNKVVIVEGYMDVIAAHQHGFTNVVACMGTSLTSDQLQQLHRFTNNFVLALDADAAGQQATVRGLNQARQSLLRVQKPTVTATGQVRLTERLSANLTIVSMPAGEDPDDVIRQQPAQWQMLVEQAQPLVDFYLQFVATQYDLQSAQGKGLAVAELAPLIAELGDEIERQHYIQQLSRQVQIDELTILNRVQAAAKTSKLPAEQNRKRSVSRFGAVQKQTDRSALDSNATPEQVPSQSRSTPRDETTERPAAGHAAQKAISQEDHLVANLLYDPELVIWLATATDNLEIPALGVSDLQSVQNQELFKALRHYLQGDEVWDLESFQETLTPLLHGYLGRLMHYITQMPNRGGFELRENIIATLIFLRIKHLSEECQNIKFLELDAMQEGNMQSAKQFSELKNRYKRELSYLQISRHSIKKLFSQVGV